MTASYAERGRARNRRALALIPLLFTAVTACGDDAPASGYYLRGRVFDGATLGPVSKAELTLLSGDGTAQATSGEDGTYSIGPIEPSSSYRIGAKASGMEAFEFTGVALPAIDPMATDRTRTVIGDVAMYKASMKSPGFKIKVESSDSRLAAKVASIDFMPAQVGTDPSKAPTALTPPAGAVVGAFAEPRGATMPNDMHTESVALHAWAANGSADIAEGTLTWGATYNVKVDAGPDFTPVTFQLTPVKSADISVVVPTTAKFPNQLPQQTQQYYSGRIYNGATLEALKNYTISLEYFDRALEGTVDADGRYVVGPLLANADYTITIEANGFRSFLSHNARLSTGGSSQLSSLYYDAYLYPEGVQAPAVKAKFLLQGDTQLPSGTVRFAPKGASSLYDEDAETPAGVGRQVWINDADLQQRAITKDFMNGSLDVEAGQFVLGVEYAVSVYGVSNYAVLSGGTFRAGVDTNPTFTLAPLTESPLDVISMSNDSNNLSSDGSIQIRFNHDIKVAPQLDQDVALRSLNDGFSINSPDKNMDSMFNVLVDAADLAPQVPNGYRGVSWEIAGNMLTLKWDRERGLKTTDAADPIIDVTYDNLSSLRLYTGTLATSPTTRLDTLLGTNSLSVQMTAQ